MLQYVWHHVEHGFSVLVPALYSARLKVVPSTFTLSYQIEILLEASMTGIVRREFHPTYSPSLKRSRHPPYSQFGNHKNVCSGKKKDLSNERLVSCSR